MLPVLNNTFFVYRLFQLFVSEPRLHIPLSEGIIDGTVAGPALYRIFLQIVMVGLVADAHVIPSALVRIIPAELELLVPTATNCVPVQITSYPAPFTPKEEAAATAVHVVPEVLYMRV
jgi:hypothetical protein